MTRVEAINLIGWLKSKTNRDDDLEAIDMAIEALLPCNELVYCWECKYKDGCSQTILLDANNKTINFCSYGECTKGGEDK